jgi:aspartate racemase
MKTIGMLAGMSYESTLSYYQYLNEEIQRLLKGSHSAKILMYSFDYYDLEVSLEKNDWLAIENNLIQQGLKLKEAGADFLMICANTMHILANQVHEKVGLPLVHIVDATKEAISNHKLKKVLLLGTKYTMESDMYPNQLLKAGVEVVIPNAREKAMIHRTIYNELIKGIRSSDSKQRFVELIYAYEKLGVEGVILGCTEIPLLIQQNDIGIPLFDTTKIHALAAIQFALEK